MKFKLRDQLITLAKERISNDDPSHDFRHAFLEELKEELS